MTTCELLRSYWRFDVVAVVVGVVLIATFARARRPGETRWRAASVAVALVTLAIATASPIAALADGYVFTAHMLQHLLLVLVVPPLALLGFAPRTGLGRPPRAVISWLLGVGAMWLWHEQTLCDAAARDAVVHGIQEVSLLVMGLAFWWPVLAPTTRSRLGPLAAIAYLATACFACTALGIIVTFSPVEVCAAFAHPTGAMAPMGVMTLVRDGWGLSAATDQQLGGLLMWIPACLIYGAAILAMLMRLYRDDATPTTTTSTGKGVS
jgi:cytochrome c oxidase assembly factor CtaG